MQSPRTTTDILLEECRQGRTMASIASIRSTTPPQSSHEFMGLPNIQLKRRRDYDLPSTTNSGNFSGRILFPLKF
eukprot:scaffold22649_cov99-Cylindrotheca_fusiformis.AAC.6